MNMLARIRALIWQLRHRRCIPSLQKHPEHRTTTDWDRGCRRCQRRMVAEGLASPRGGWEW